MTEPEKRGQTNIRDVFGSVLSGVFNAPVYVTNLINEQVFKRLGVEQRVGFILLAILFVSGIVGLYFTLRPKQPTQMAGDFRITVIGFVENNGHKSQLGLQLAQDVFTRLEEDFADMDLDFTVTVLGPNRRWVSGKNRSERADSAEKLAQKIGADIVIYGTVDTTGAEWVVTPEFFVASENFYDADEVTGQYEVGEAFSVVGERGTFTRVAINDKLSPRVTLLSEITTGLARYALHDYARALETFEHAMSVSEDVLGVRGVLYLLMGNAAGKMSDLDAAETYHQKSIEALPDYARPYVGLAGVYYLRSLQPFQESLEPTDIDTSWLYQAIDTYQQALQVENQPPLSDIETKVHFGLGQCYTMLVYSGNETFFDAAIVEFKAVIAAYNNGANPRVREQTAESHARLGLIYDLSGYYEWSVEEYRNAVDLLNSDLERQQLYSERADAVEDKLVNNSH